MKRAIFIALIGVFIIGGASASALVEVDCTQCGGARTIECDECRHLVICPTCDPAMVYGGFLGSSDCPDCGGLGLARKSTGIITESPRIECGCRAENPECSFCRGRGWYAGRSRGICEACDGEGGRPCPGCDGSGKIGANQRFLEILGVR